MKICIFELIKSLGTEGFYVDDWEARNPCKKHVPHLNNS